MPRLSLSLLGRFEITLDSQPVTGIETDKARALLAYLALEADHPHRRQSLAALLWPDHEEGAARANLRNALYNLRQALRAQPFLAVTTDAVRFERSSNHWLDVAAFENLADAAPPRSVEPGDEPTPAPFWEQACALYRGDFLQGFAIHDSAVFEEWATLTRERLRNKLLATLRRLAQSYEREGQLTRAVTHAQRLVALDPWEEENQRQLLRLLALSGQRGAALAQYESCRRTLGEELGVEPQEETTRLYKRIRDGKLPALAEKAARLRNLPASLTPFIGRELELDQLLTRLHDPACRLLTITGPGGSGKTRLAIEAAMQTSDDFADGACFIPLGALPSTEAILPAIAEALGFSFSAVESGQRERASPKQRLLGYLATKHLLLLFDGFEHLLNGASLLAEILRTAPRVCALVTSRVKLSLQGEHLFLIAGLPCPASAADGDENYGAPALFVQGARRVRPEYAAGQPEEVARICRLLEGMPLAILLASAWTETLSPAEIAAQIEHASLDFLATERPEMPQRQRSMRAVFSHSWALLSQREQERLSALAVFRGGWTAEAAEEVAGATQRDLLRLVDKSLLYRTTAGRYGMHDLLRQFAAERLAESTARVHAARDRHATLLARKLGRWGEDRRRPRARVAQTELAAEGENARAAWEWAVEQERADWLAQSAAGMAWLYPAAVRTAEGEAVFRAAAERVQGGTSEGDLRLLARLLTQQSLYLDAQKQPQRARESLAQALALLERPELSDKDVRAERAAVLQAMSDRAYEYDHDLAASERFGREALGYWRVVEDEWGIAAACCRLGVVAGWSDRFSEARQLLQEAQTLWRELGDQESLASALSALGLMLLYQGQVEQALAHVEEVVAILRGLGDRAELAEGLAMLGSALFGLGRFLEARAALAESLAVGGEELGARTRLAWLCGVEAHLGHYAEARAIAHRILQQGRESHDEIIIGTALMYLGSLQFDTADWAAAYAYFQESLSVLGDRAALVRCKALVGRASAAYHLGRVEEGWRGFVEGLGEILRTGVLGDTAENAVGIFARLFAEEGQAERAVELWALLCRYPWNANSRGNHDAIGRFVEAAAATLPAEVVAAAQERGRARDLRATVQELRAEAEHKITLL